MCSSMLRTHEWKGAPDRLRSGDEPSRSTLANQWSVVWRKGEAVGHQQGKSSERVRVRSTTRADRRSSEIGGAVTRPRLLLRLPTDQGRG